MPADYERITFRTSPLSLDNPRSIMSIDLANAAKRRRTESESRTISGASNNSTSSGGSSSQPVSPGEGATGSKVARALSKPPRAATVAPPAAPTDLFSFFRKLSNESDFEALFNDVVVVLALFRSLQETEKVIVLRLLSIPEPIRWDVMIVWLSANRRAAMKSVSTLRQYRMIVLRQQPIGTRAAGSGGSAAGSSAASALSGASSSSFSSSSSAASRRSGQSARVDGSDAGGSSSSINRTPHSTDGTRGPISATEIRYSLHGVFRKTLIRALREGAASSPIIGTACSSKPAKDFPTRCTLDQHAASKWRNVLQWIVQGSTGLSLESVRSSRFAGLEPPEASGTARIDNPDLLLILERLELATKGSHTRPNKTEPFVSSSVTPTGGPVPGNLPSGSGVREELVKNPLVKTASRLSSRVFRWFLNDTRSQILSICLEYLHCVHYGIINPSVSTTNSTSSPRAFTNPSESVASGLPGRPFPPGGSDAESRQLTEILSLLFTLTESLIGQPCLLSGLTPAQSRFIAVACELGLVWMQQRASDARFCFPTPFVKLLRADSPDMPFLNSVISSMMTWGSGDDSAKNSTPLHLSPDLYHSAYLRFFIHKRLGSFPPEPANLGLPQATTPGTSGNLKAHQESGIIVESNFKVFIFACCPLLIAITARLCELRVITPCLVVGIMTRESVQAAYKSGVTAQQLLRFLITHAHSSIYSKSQATGKPLIPPNVEKSLLIWEAERHRVQLHKACAFVFSKESDIHVFPLAVSRAAGSWLLTSTESPATNSGKEFEEWRVKTVDRLNGKEPLPTHQKSAAPVLVIRAQFKNEMSAYIRSSLKQVRR